jgi:serine protease Do
MDIIPKREGYTFIGCYLDKFYKESFDPSSPIFEDTVLYALWYFDALEYVNSVSKEVLASNVFIAIYNRDIFGNPNTLLGYTSGSGVIYKEDSLYYYILTNNHVVSKEDSVIVITDAYGNEHTATVISKDKNYDLAVLRIRKSGKALPLVSLAKKNIEYGGLVCSIGNPNSLTNSVTLGNAVSYQTVDVKESDKEHTNVTFEVLWHSCPTDHGSSGGAVFNSNLELCGINYGGIRSDSSSDYRYAIAIPVEKVREFLIANQLMP